MLRVGVVVAVAVAAVVDVVGIVAVAAVVDDVWIVAVAVDDVAAAAVVFDDFGFARAKLYHRNCRHSATPFYIPALAYSSPHQRAEPQA